MHLAFTRMPGEQYRQRFRSVVVFTDIFRALTLFADAYSETRTQTLRASFCFRSKFQCSLEKKLRRIAAGAGDPRYIVSMALPSHGGVRQVERLAVDLDPPVGQLMHDFIHRIKYIYIIMYSFLGCNKIVHKSQGIEIFLRNNTAMLLYSKARLGISRLSLSNTH